MARLSNFLRRHDSFPPDPRELVCRPVQRHEIDAALRLLLSGSGGLASDEQVLDFLSYAVHRGVDVNGVWVASRRDRIEWALMPVTSPGRTMLVLSPARLFRQTSVDALAALSEAVCRHHAVHGINLAQLLIDPEQPDVARAYEAAGFTRLAELVYLRRAVRGGGASTTGTLDLPRDFELRTYSPELEQNFARAITASYEGSLDCPGLNGLRDIHDVLEGHRASGEFAPHLWHVLLERGEERAVLLLNRSLQPDAMELVYLGLLPAARGRGIGDRLMQLAMSATAADAKRELTLAVDSRNVPAMKLYFRHGMQRVGSRLAMIRDVRKLRDEAVLRDEELGGAGRSESRSTNYPQVP